MGEIIFYIALFLVLVGLWGVITRKNLIKIIIAFDLFDTGINTLLVYYGYAKDGKAPIGQVANMVDPVPQAMVLTSIVIGLGVTAVMLFMAYRLSIKTKNLNIDKVERLKW